MAGSSTAEASGGQAGRNSPSGESQLDRPLGPVCGDQPPWLEPPPSRSQPASRSASGLPAASGNLQNDFAPPLADSGTVPGRFPGDCAVSGIGEQPPHSFNLQRRGCQRRRTVAGAGQGAAGRFLSPTQIKQSLPKAGISGYQQLPRSDRPVAEFGDLARGRADGFPAGRNQSLGTLGGRNSLAANRGSSQAALPVCVCQCRGRPPFDGKTLVQRLRRKLPAGQYEKFECRHCGISGYGTAGQRSPIAGLYRH
jgi:hypothetical protein